MLSLRPVEVSALTRSFEAWTLAVECLGHVFEAILVPRLGLLSQGEVDGGYCKVAANI